MRHVRQPKNEGYCGQACIAMIADISLEVAKKVTRPRGRGTTTAELVKALRRLGFSCPDKMTRLSRKDWNIEGLAIVRMNHRRSGRWHWLVVDDGKLLDPSPYGLSVFSKISSYLPIRRRQ